MLKTQNTNQLNVFPVTGIGRNIAALKRYHKTGYHTWINGIFYLNLFSLVRLSIVKNHYFPEGSPTNSPGANLNSQRLARRVKYKNVFHSASTAFCYRSSRQLLLRCSTSCIHAVVSYIRYPHRQAFLARSWLILQTGEYRSRR